jgi:FK506-binding protein 1
MEILKIFRDPSLYSVIKIRTCMYIVGTHRAPPISTASPLCMQPTEIESLAGLEYKRRARIPTSPIARTFFPRILQRANIVRQTPSNIYIHKTPNVQPFHEHTHTPPKMAPHPNEKSTATIEVDEENQNIITVTRDDKPGHVIVTIENEGEGDRPTTGQKVTMEYTGWVKDETRESGRAEKSFDSSVGRGDFVTPIGVGRVITGWDEGVTLLKTGGNATLEISPEWGYGARGFPGAIPPNATLIFEVTLKKFQ